MNIHEYQAKRLLALQGLAIPHGLIAFSAAEVEQNFLEIGAPVCAVKSQILAGGRGKGQVFDGATGKELIMEGGVKLAYSAAEARRIAENLFGNILVTNQTGPAGRVVRRVYVEAGCRVEQARYLAILLDRSKGLPVLVAGIEGGMDIEESAARAPEKIMRFPFDPREGLWPYQARRVAQFLGLKAGTVANGVKYFIAAAHAFCALDCTLLEINPLAVTPENQILALDAKIILDDNGLIRHKEFEALRDLDEEEPAETEARKHGLSYIALNGDIGCLVNGAGLAMATMDLIKLHGHQPANFLDVGGGASQENVAVAFKIILHDPKVKAILVNIFGGIMRCDLLAGGVISAARQTGLKVPLVVRLEGSNMEAGKQLLAQSGLPIHSAASLEEAAEKVSALASVAAGCT
jgi:succinyl-CoA synthetase beta subunit